MHAARIISVSNAEEARKTDAQDSFDCGVLRLCEATGLDACLIHGWYLMYTSSSYFCFVFENRVLEACHSNSGSQTSVSVTWKPLRNVESLAPPQTYSPGSGLEHGLTNFSVKGQILTISAFQAMYFCHDCSRLPAVGAQKLPMDNMQTDRCSCVLINSNL